MKKEDVYITILRFGKSKGVGGVTCDELFVHLHEKGHITQEELDFFGGESKPIGEKRNKWLHICHLFAESSPNTTNTNDGRRSMSMDSYFKLIEHQELVEARNNSISARRFSYAAIIIAILAPIGSLFFSYQQSQQPIILNHSQLNELKIQSFDDTRIVESVRALSDNQTSANELLEDVITELMQNKNNLKSDQITPKMKKSEK